MRAYRDDAAAIRALVEPERVHRDTYLSAELFELEQERLFAATWVYVAHASQVPKAGDYVTTEIAGRPLVLVRASDGALHVLLNRCAHKGAMVLTDRAGNTGRGIRCPYHAWAYRLDGTLAAVPLPKGYEGTSLRECESARGLTRVASGEHRGFVFARLSPTGPEFREYFGAALECIDAMADRSPEGALEIAGAPLRALIAANWKIYLENINDSLHANVTHESVTSAAERVWKAQPPGTPKPTAMEQLLPFASDDSFYSRMGGRTMPNGHTILGTAASIHSGYSAVPEYDQAMIAAYGEARAKQILSWSPQNAILYPSIAIKGSPQTMRVIRPLGPARTLVETWAFRPQGAPDALLARTQLYNRLVFSPMSIIAHDDVHVFETIQRGLRTAANPWVSLHREFDPTVAPGTTAETSGMSEALMRNQHAAWVHWMARAA
jgi:phenylpropionate dioxygenase-like ring-hydroxylating dioxygenase large terminal subunit